ncbi:hypothetical protein LRS06_18465 [Hymenobacter sp. J193]|uniref:hypothetical protein n=1 Tax=Hymenobacter sp. J193 TaxID=2898429 RepID=UPI002151B37F|nr:hypothetical protein [Hymenobacter sp. J193]MCR5889719.1 hypothetical protein [Hymenobacter sp. J193]
MTYLPKYGPQAQTPQQRARILVQMKAANPVLYKDLPPALEQLHARYIAGELSWTDVCYLREQEQAR